LSDIRGDIVSVADRTRPVAAGGAVIAAHFLGDTAVFVLGEEAVVLAAPERNPQHVTIHGGAILEATADGKRLISCGDDGKVVETLSDGTTRTAGSDAKRRWIDHVAIAPDGTVAWSAGKTAYVAATEPRELELPSTVGGLAFMTKGFRLAIAHYNGVTLWFPNAPQAKPELLEWKGSHLAVTVSPDCRFLITAMQEPMLHGWRLPERQNMRMSGYAARVTSFGWTAGGRFLATSGANQLILWPFQSREGPMGKQPTMLAPSEHRVVAVGCHPREDVIAVGYQDGMILLVRLADGAEILAKRPAEDPTDAQVTALAWSANGRYLGFGTEAGQAGIIDLA
jgi:WD40 repeat protein